MLLYFLYKVLLRLFRELWKNIRSARHINQATTVKNISPNYDPLLKQKTCTVYKKLNVAIGKGHIRVIPYNLYAIFCIRKHSLEKCTTSIFKMLRYGSLKKTIRRTFLELLHIKKDNTPIYNRNDIENLPHIYNNLIGFTYVLPLLHWAISINVNGHFFNCITSCMNFTN